MAFETIIYEVDGSTAVLTLNRPEKLNAICAIMVRELNDALDLAEANDDVRVIVLKGAGRAFSAGFDLDSGNGGEANDLEALRRELTDDFNIIMRFWDCPKPTIAAVHKYCLGGALEMAAACDVTIAADDCRFGEPEVQFGSGIVVMILPWLIGPKAAKELLLTGDDKLSAERAASMGLVNKVVAPEELHGSAFAVAKTLSANDQLAVKLTKQAINRAYDVMGMRDALLQALELDIVIESTETPESKMFNDISKKEGLKAAIAWRRNRFAENSQKKLGTQENNGG